MATDILQDILQHIRNLPAREQLEVLAELRRRSGTQSQLPQVHSILELEGLGEEAWRGIDAQEYVQRERSSWNG